MGFVLWESDARAPIVPLELLRSRQLAKTYSLEILIGILEGSLFFIPTVLVGALGLSYFAAGAVAALGALTFVAVIPLSGAALDRRGSRDVLLVGTVLTEIGLAIFALGFGSLWVTLLAMIVAGAGFGALLGAPTRYIVTNETPQRARATAVGFLSQALIVGQILGSSLAGFFFAAQSDVVGYRNAYLAFCAVAFVALVLASTLKPQRDERTHPIRGSGLKRHAANLADMATHVVENQPPVLEDYNLFTSDRALREAVAREAPAADSSELEGVGRAGRARRDHRAGVRSQRTPTRAAHARPLRTPHRRRSFPSGLARTARPRDQRRLARNSVARPLALVRTRAAPPSSSFGDRSSRGTAVRSR